MKIQSIASMLAGGDRRAIGNAGRIAALILKSPERFAEVMECLVNGDPVVRMRAADAAEKASAKMPALLTEYRDFLLDLARESEQAEVRWHLAQMIPRLKLGRRERAQAIATLHSFLSDRSSIVKTCALQAIVELSSGDRELEADARALLDHAINTGTPAMRARSRKLIAHLE